MDSGTTISVVDGDEIQFKGNNSSYSYYDDDEDDYVGNNLLSTVDCNVYGNIMSLTDGDNFENANTVNDYAFCYLFYDYFEGESFPVVDAKNLILPATTLTNGCYINMFAGCTSLTSAPALPATTLAEDCYYNMFAGCTSLTTAPSVLPATTLASNCYSSMFYHCTSLTTAPELPATTLAKGCYASMFFGCTSLNYIKCLATDISASNYTNAWVNGVASSGTFVKNPNMSSWTTGYNGIPTGWTVQDA